MNEAKIISKIMDNCTGDELPSELIAMGLRAGLSVIDPSMEYGVTYVDPTSPVTVVKTISEAKKSQEFYNQIGNGKYLPLIMVRTEGIDPGPWVHIAIGES